MSSLFKISWRMMWSRKWVTFATLFALILPTALGVILLVVRYQTEGALKKDAGQFDLVVGAKGGAMQLVLSSLYHLGMPTGNILYEDYEKILKDKRVKAAEPIGLGDNYEGYRIVGTEAALFQLKKQDGSQMLSFTEGREFSPDGFEAVVGAQVARLAGLTVGETFHGTHGLLSVPGAELHSEFTYKVVGVLNPTGSAQDRAIFVPLSAVWKVHHAEESVHQVFKNAQPIQKEVTAVLVQLESAGLRLWMLDELKKEPNLMAAVPINEVLAMSQVYLAPFQKMLFLITIGVIAVSCLVILLALYQAIERRERSLLTLRSLGAKRTEISLILFNEVALIVFFGVILGCLVGHVVVQVLSGLVYQKTGLILNAWSIAPGELSVVGGITAVLLLIGLLPVVSIYRKTAI